jgi:UDP-glucose 4-epimerase
VSAGVRVIVTGGAGFIGSNLVHALLAGGHDVLVIDDLSTGVVDNLDPRAAFRKLDILDDSLPALFAEFRPDAVVHLAAQASVVVSLRDPERDRAVNAEGTRRIAAAARDAGAKRVISASSAAVYGEPEVLPLPETARTEPLSPYGCSKLEAESLLARELEDSATDYASFRFANVYGPRQDAQGEGGVVAIFCARLAAGENPVVYGDGSQTRDFIFVGDVVAAIITAIGFQGSLGQGDALHGAYNIGTGTATSVSELLMTIRTAAAYFGPAETGPAREGDIAHSRLSPERACDSFGFSASVELDRGIAMTWNWFSAKR